MFKIKPIKVRDISDKYNKYLKKYPQLPKFFFRMAIVAKSNSGKTDLTINLMRFLMDYSGWISPDDIILFSPTIMFGDNAEKYGTLNLNRENIYTDINEDTLMRVLNQRMQMQRPYILLVDDLSEDLHFNKLLNALLTKIRHTLGNIIICCHKWKCLSTMIRNNLSHIILMKGLDENLKEFNSVCEELGGKYGPDGFKKIFNEATKEPYSFLYIDNTPGAKFKYRKNLDYGLKVD